MKNNLVNQCLSRVRLCPILLKSVVCSIAGEAAPPDLQPRGLLPLAEEMGQEAVQRRHRLPLPHPHELGLRLRQISEQLVSRLPEPDAHIFRL